MKNLWPQIKQIKQIFIRALRWLIIYFTDSFLLDLWTNGHRAERKVNLFYGFYLVDYGSPWKGLIPHNRTAHSILPLFGLIDLSPCRVISEFIFGDFWRFNYGKDEKVFVDFENLVFFRNESLDSENNRKAEKPRKQ